MGITDRQVTVTMKGHPVELLGQERHTGDAAPNFRAVDAGFQPVELAQLGQRPVLISAVPSLDTGLCALQTKRFNSEIASFEGDFAALTISMDLPFAQKRFCEAEGIDRIQVVSDHVWREFGNGYGILIKDMGLLARSVFVIGKDGQIRYKQTVPEVTDHPDYEAALAALREAVQA